ncbi:unnamed protein product [Durusdinium trenchii]|uniref:Uncharacterized protein n=2 Tax=Durusdinium trenchii TaxID=1381693 RepID=A0ABP0SGK1_9DINO
MVLWLLMFISGVLLGLGVSHVWKWRPSSRSPSSAQARRRRQYVPRGSGGEQIRGSSADAQRTVLCEDAIAWLQSISALPTGVPDIHELDNITLAGYVEWFQMTVKLILEKLPAQSRAIFMQTDVKVTKDGNHGRNAKGGTYWQWLNKAHLAILAASDMPGVRLLWHRIIFSGKIVGGGRSGFSAGYTHYLCFTNDEADESLDRGFPDVIRKGLSTWTSGAGVNSVELACNYLKSCGCRIVVDPFCGEGAVLAVANALQLQALGVEHSQKRARQARCLDGQALLEADHAEFA